MFCPLCRTEYREGFDVCADCKVPLVDDLQDQSPEMAVEVPAEAPEHDDLVVVLDTDDHGFLSIVQAWLDSAGIYYAVRGIRIAGHLEGIRTGRPAGSATGYVQLAVQRNDVDNAKGLIADIREEQASEDDDVDFGDEEDGRTIEIPAQTTECGETASSPSAGTIVPSQTKTLFRALVIAEIVFMFLCIKTTDSIDKSLPISVRTHLDSLRQIDVSLHDTFNALNDIVFCVKLVASIGLILFWKPARYIYLLPWLWVMMVAMLDGGTITHGPDALYSYLQVLTGGAIMAMMYYSSVKPAFLRTMQ